jgi:hypothetical protein
LAPLRRAKLGDLVSFQVREAAGWPTTVDSYRAERPI